jgi:flavin reductase (DIM6/NTAB) family NADH-FMN oxidoreductase RutF
VSKVEPKSGPERRTKSGPERRILRGDSTEPGAFVGTLKAIVVPRPIAWVSTVSADGVANLAPHSFFTVASQLPPVIQFTSIGHNDSLRNALETGEFVVSLANREMFDEINATGTNYPPEVDEFEAVGVAAEPSELVAPPRVAGSPAAIECVTERTVEFDHSVVVFGRVVAIAIDESVLDGDHPEITKLRPLARLGRDEWSETGQILRAARIPYDD